MRRYGIIFDARHLQNPYTGLGRYTHSLLKSLLLSAGERPIEVILNRSVVDQRANKIVEELLSNLPSARKLYVDASPFQIKPSFELLEFINKSKLEVYFYPHFNVPMGVKKPSIFVVHDLIPLKVANYIQSLQAAKKFFFKSSILYNLRHKNRLCIADSDATKNDLLALAGPDFSAKITRVYPGLSYAFNDSNETEYSNKIGGAGNRRFLFYIGDRRPHKNLRRVVDIFAILQRDFHYEGELVIAGSCENFHFNLEEYAKKVSRVRLVGQISDGELQRAYQQMDALLFLSQYEGFGLPVIEAASENKKVIVLNNSSLLEVCPPSGLILNGNLENTELARQINNYLKVEVSSDNRSFLDRFSWRKAAEVIFDDIASRLLDR